MASISKTIMVTAIMQLWEDDLFNLDDNINDYLQPDFQVINPWYPNDTITFKMLMTHTSSINDNWSILRPVISCGDSPIPLDSFLVNYLTPGGVYYHPDNFNGFAPSSDTFDYTNVGSSILAYIVEKLSDIPFDQYCRENIFDPLDMDETSWFLEGLDTTKIATPYEWTGSQYVANCHQGWPVYPAAFLRTNKIELEHFLSAYMNWGTYNGATILDSTTVNTMLTVYKPVPTQNVWQGLIWYQQFLNGRYLWDHTGGWTGAAATIMFFHPEEDWGFTAFVNLRAYINSLNIISDAIIEYASKYGEIYAINTKLNKHYIRPSNDTIIVRTEFSNFNQHDFTSNAIYINSDSSYIDSTALYDDGLHGDSLAGDGLWGAFIHSISEEEIYSVGISTIDIQTGKYFHTGDLTRFTTAGPMKVDSLSITQLPNSYRVKPFIKNEGQSFTVENLLIIMSSNDSSVTNISGSVTITNIAPGEVVEPTSSFFVSVDSNFSGVFNFNFEIKSGGWLYWKDSISIITNVEDEVTSPVSYRLYQNYPNPFNPVTIIEFALPIPGFVTLSIFNILGEQVATLVFEYLTAGSYKYEWNASELTSGIYIYRLKSGNFVSIKKMVLMK
jgi:CubicO group peptidase (beta-lactamase class C family)